MRSVQIPFFKIWYSSAFVILFLITLVLTLVSPADLIYQSVKADSIANVASVAAVYLVTALFCLFIWASRIYTNRAVLRDIPKGYVPIDNGEVPRKVRRLIERMWRRSALVAWDARPRDVSAEMEEEARRDESEPQPRDHLFHHRTAHLKVTSLVPAKNALKAWGHIAHPGWSPPSIAAGQPQSVQYWSVLVELPHLIEAKAVSLAPPDPTFPVGGSSVEAVHLPPDHRVVSLLKRTPAMDFREYFGHLASLGMLEDAIEAEHFMQQYEHARFSTKPLTETEFELLMATFSSLLSAMSLDVTRLAPFLDQSDLDSDTTISNYPTGDAASLVSDMDDSVRHHRLHLSTSPSNESLDSVIIKSQTVQ